ncbi:hypothetical protein [Moritella dasanensis]|uniref:hypothetical protein n=1 Tax=Moritella dasanensis TaxID=428031 RepID=UPI0012F8E7FE|nr:hypothetical protein [Moritella dasanensis]
MTVERYKFILEKIKYLDTQFNVNLSNLKKISIALIGVIISSIAALKDNKISLELTEFTIEVSSLILVFSCIFFIIMTDAIKKSWVDYRFDEVNLLNKVSCDLGRKYPSGKWKLHWSETHFLLGVMLWGSLNFFLFYNSKSLILNMI